METGFQFHHLNFQFPKKANTPTKITQPFRTIESGSLSDDFYSNFLDWSQDKIFYCENNRIFQYNFYTANSMLVFDDQSTGLCSIKCIDQNNTLVMGTSSGSVIFLDLNTLKATRHMVHKGRVSAIEALDQQIVTGSRDRKAKVIDLRSKNPVKVYSFHNQEICGVSRNRDGRFLATGGNDNRVVIIDMRQDETMFCKMEEHKAAVKALSWSPLHGTKLISGGGTADKTLKVWDIQNEKPLKRSVAFESQICSVKWLENDKILSSFGYSNDDIKLLKDFEVEREYSGHRNRVIHMAVEGKEEFFVSGSGDKEIKVWRIEDNTKELPMR